jgi:CBS domain containing-hemolysin-like protein
MTDTPSFPWFAGSPALGIALAFLLVLLNGFFVAAEFALIRVRPTQLARDAEGGNPSARVAQRMIEHLGDSLAATQLGVTLCSLALGWIGEPAFTRLLEPLVALVAGPKAPIHHVIGLIVSFLAITMLHVSLGELSPKWLALRNAERAILRLALPLFVFSKVTYPITWVLRRSTSGLLRLFGLRPLPERAMAHDEEELRRLLASSESTEVSEGKRELLDNVFELSHRVARQIMLPRQDVVYLSTTTPVEESLRIARRSGHTRLPLCRADLDHVIGVVHIKDLFRLERPPRSLEEVAREMSFVPETLALDRLLVRMRTERFHLAAVIDEYGGVSGIVTLEDVIEELVGQIHDEFDSDNPAEFVREREGVYLVSGGMLVEDLEDALHLELSERDEDTIAGVVFSELGRNPAVGDRVRLGPLTLEVLAIDGNRIRTLRATVETATPVAAGGDREPAAD